MAYFNINNIAIKGITACVPKNKFEIKNYSHFSDQEKLDFTNKVGVASKRTSEGKLTAADLCLAAAEKLIAELGWNKSEIGVLILITQTPDYIFPSSAIILQDKLGLSKNTLAFDINLGCSGWIYGLATISSMLLTTGKNKALLLAGDTAVMADYADKASFPLIADAGTATAIEISSGAGPMFFNTYSDGSGYDAIITKNSGSRYVTTGLVDAIPYRATLNGQKVLEFCLREVAPSVKALLQDSGIDKDQIDYFVFHQANKIINESLRKRLAIPIEKFPYSINEFGNTSSASIPLTIVTALRDKLKNAKCTLFCSGFGVGLSWANMVFTAENLLCPELVEI